MKKTGIVIICMLLVFVLAFAGNVTAYNADYTHVLYQSSVVPVIDGTYTADDPDWIASGKQEFGEGAVFHDQWVMEPNLLCLIVEVTDLSNNAEDKLTICFDGTADGGATEPDGGPNPTAYDKKLEITAHGTTQNIQWFVGNGSGWVESNDASAELLDYAQVFVSTPTILELHNVYEMNIMKLDTSLGSPLMGYTWAEYISYYDEGTSETRQWPPQGNPDVPDSWGYIPYAQEPNPTPTIPEGTGFVVMLTVSSVAVAGALLLRKRKKLSNLN